MEETEQGLAQEDTTDTHFFVCVYHRGTAPTPTPTPGPGRIINNRVSGTEALVSHRHGSACCSPQLCYISNNGGYELA